jgi:hypothetical protein
MMVAVNFYGGNARGGVQGEFRIAIGNQTYAQPFHIKAEQGNRGGDRDKLIQSGIVPENGWVAINPISALTG